MLKLGPWRAIEALTLLDRFCASFLFCEMVASFEPELKAIFSMLDVLLRIAALPGISACVLIRPRPTAGVIIGPVCSFHYLLLLLRGDIAQRFEKLKPQLRGEVLLKNPANSSWTTLQGLGLAVSPSWSVFASVGRFRIP